MKQAQVFTFFCCLACLLNASTIEMTATDLGEGDYLIELIQTEFNPTGTGGVLRIPVGGWTVKEMTVLPTINYHEGQYWGWSWLLAGITVNENNEVQISAVPGLGVGTPGIGTVIDPIFNDEQYTSTASFVLSTALEDPPEGYKWEYSGARFALHGQWDNEIYDPYTWIPPLGTPTPVLVPVPEPFSMTIFALGGLFLKRKRKREIGQ